jgi:serine phosphatase RsbU (regulator of sigma subunit)
MYSRERLIAAVRERVRLPSAELFAELFGEIRQFSKRTEFSDDVCLVGMDVKRLCDTWRCDRLTDAAQQLICN